VCWGIGSDIAGSVRIPALWNGIPGFKPTPMRLSVQGHCQVSPFTKDSNGTQLLIIPSFGPLAKSCRDLREICKYFLEGHCNMYDMMAPPMPFNTKEAYHDWSDISSRKMKVGYIMDYEIIELSPMNRRAMEMVKNQLIKEGHELYEFKIPDEINLMRNMLRLLSCDSHHDEFLNNWAYGEPI